MSNFTTKHPDLALAIGSYLDFIRQDYRTKSAMGQSHGEEMDAWFEPGRKFVKVLTRNHNQDRVHSFIVIADFKTFKAGDILMAASFWAPALNKARGNVLDLNYGTASWTGAGYL
jgi:hypothetical protein